MQKTQCVPLFAAGRHLCRLFRVRGPTNSTPVDEFAAAELALLLGQVTSATIPVTNTCASAGTRFAVGLAAATSMGLAPAATAWIQTKVLS
jgi:hypothetical protein